jgi:hypothetical protein
LGVGSAIDTEDVVTSNNAKSFRRIGNPLLINAVPMGWHRNVRGK